MKSLCTIADHKSHLERLVTLVRTRELNGTQAWSAFSNPEALKKFTLKDGTTQAFNFSKEECKTFKVLRQATQKKLFEAYGRTCSYCRRPVGHYGFGWHIEHVLPKSKYGSLTFELSNLTIGCVDCNMWKGRRVDKKVENKTLPIINPIQPGFRYSDHLRYLQLCTEDLSFTKYLTKSELGKKTYTLLSFSELERAQAVNSIDSFAAALHERFSRAMSVEQANPDAQELLAFLGDLKSSIYRRP